MTLPHFHHWSTGEIVAAAREVSRVTWEDIVSDQTHQPIVKARENVIAALVIIRGLSLTEAADVLGKPYHSTVFSALKRFRKRPPEDQVTALMAIGSRMIEHAEQRIKAREAVLDAQEQIRELHPLTTEPESSP